MPAYSIQIQPSASNESASKQKTAEDARRAGHATDRLREPTQKLYLGTSRQTEMRYSLKLPSPRRNKNLIGFAMSLPFVAIL